MKKRILWNDIKGNRLLAVTTWLFMAVCAFMVALTCFLFSSLMASVDTLMEKGTDAGFSANARRRASRGRTCAVCRRK